MILIELGDLKIGVGIVVTIDMMMYGRGWLIGKTYI